MSFTNNKHYKTTFPSKKTCYLSKTSSQTFAKNVYLYSLKKIVIYDKKSYYRAFVS